MWIDQRGSEIIERPEALRLLSVAAVRRDHGRLGVTIVGNPDEAPLVVPVDFVVDDRRVLVRLGPGRLCELTVGRLVAFEVDEVAALGDTAPAPSVPDPGHRIIAVRLDAVTGRRFTVSPPEPATLTGGAR